MKTIISLICTMLVYTYTMAQMTVDVKNPQIPILIDRHDNILCYLRVDAPDAGEVNSITLRFGEGSDTNSIKSLRVYYSGTEAPERDGKKFFAPVQYLSREIPSYTRTANQSYSITLAETDFGCGNDVTGNIITMDVNKKLLPGVNYFWISIEMKPDTPLSSKISMEIISLATDNGQYIAPVCETIPVRCMGIGVRYAGDSEAAAYRIPGLVTSNGGTLLAVYDVRYNNSRDLQEHISIGLSRSTTKGQTWEDMRIIMDFGEFGGLPRAQNGVGDPAILVDKQSGTIWVVAVWTHGIGNGAAWTNSLDGMDIGRTGQLVMVSSNDDGKTWSQPRNITPQIKDPSWTFLLQGPGNGITMHDGTLVFACQYKDSAGMPYAAIMYSRDKGNTWHLHKPARQNTTEAQVIELEPGVLMLNMRDNRGGSRAVAVTSDMGMTWTEHSSSRSALREPVCMGSLIKAGNHVAGSPLLLFSNPDHEKERKDITIKASIDGGLTWPAGYQLLLDEEYGWGYSCMTMIDDDTVGILYEGSTAHMVFQSIGLNDILAVKE